MSEEDVLKACRDLNIRPDALGYITVAQLGALLGVCRRTLYSWRDTGQGPRFIMRGGRLRYSLRAVAAYFDELEGADGQ